MANEISLVTASGRTVTPKDDAIIYEVFSPGNGIIYGGVVSIKDSSTLHITAGHGIVCGRKFTIDDSDIPVSLSGSGSLLGRLYIHLDLADVADPITLLVETGATLTPEVHDSDVNVNNGVYDINIATFTVDTVTIDNLVNIDNTIAPIDFGTADISGIGDGSIKGAISELNADINDVSVKVPKVILDEKKVFVKGTSITIPNLSSYDYALISIALDSALQTVLIKNTDAYMLVRGADNQGTSIRTNIVQGVINGDVITFNEVAYIVQGGSAIDVTTGSSFYIDRVIGFKK